jgi:hypothetical protein
MLPLENGPPLYETFLVCAGAWCVLASHWAADQAGKRLARRSVRMSHRDAAAPAKDLRIQSSKIGPGVPCSAPRPKGVADRDAPSEEDDSTRAGHAGAPVRDRAGLAGHRGSAPAGG